MHLMTKHFVTRSFSDKHNVTKPGSSPNNSSVEMKSLGDDSCSSPKTIFLVVSIEQNEECGMDD